MTETPDAMRASRSGTARIEPSIPVAIGVFVAYVIAFEGLAATSGIAYADWFATGANAWRAAVIPLLAATLVLVAFLAWARWDHVFRDPGQLSVTRSMKVAMTLLAVGIVVHVVGIDYGGITSDTILPIIVTGIGVGFAEETMFRGVILRALRTDHRREFTVIWVSSVWFGFFHLTNIINGTPALTVLQQCVVASLTGVVLYSFRRWRGLLVAGMAAHGLWDVSVFFPASELGVLFVLAFQVVIVISAIVVIFALRRERVTVTSQGVVDLGDRRAAA